MIIKPAAGSERRPRPFDRICGICLDGPGLSVKLNGAEVPRDHPTETCDAAADYVFEDDGTITWHPNPERDI